MSTSEIPQPVRGALGARSGDPQHMKDGSVELHDFVFGDGQTLASLKLHNLTLGTPRRDASGAIANGVEPVWEELNRRSAVVFIHPTTPHLVKVLPGVPGPIEDYPAETTRSAFHLVMTGHLTRFSSTKIILSHGGGFLPYAATRFAELQSSLAPDRTAEELTATMQSFDFDTALSAPSGFPSLLAFAPRGHVVVGTDYPYASEAVSKKFTRNMDNYDRFITDEFDEINRGSRTLFPRIQARSAPGRV